MQPSYLLPSGSVRALRKLPQLLIAVAAALCLSAAPASAGDPGVIVKVHQDSGIVSPYFQLQGAPGRSVRAGSLELVNPTARTVTARLDPVDALTTNTLGSAYAMRGTAIHGSTTWVRLSRPTVTLAPHASESVAVSVRVPSSAAPGDYLAGVAVEALGQSQSSKRNKGLVIGETDRYAIGVELTLPGARHPALAFTGARAEREPSGLVFLLAARNRGNVILKNVHGWVRVTKKSRLTAETSIQPGTFVSDTSISYPLPAPREQPTEGTTYRVRAALYYQGRATYLDTLVTFNHAGAVMQQNYGGRRLPPSTPWWIWAIAAMAACGALAGLARWLRRRGRPLARAAGLTLLERSLAAGSGPVSIALLNVDGDSTRALAAAIRPRLRPADRICELAPDRLLVICPAAGPRAAAALHDDLSEHLAGHPELADKPIRLSHATATTAVGAAELIGEAEGAIGRCGPQIRPRDGETASTRDP